MATSLSNAVAHTCVHSPSSSSYLHSRQAATSTHYSRFKGKAAGLSTLSESRSIAATTPRHHCWHLHHAEHSHARHHSTYTPSHSARASGGHVGAPEVNGEADDDRGDSTEFPALNPDAFGELVAVVPISNGPDPKKDPSSRYRVQSATDSRSQEGNREKGEKALTALLQFLSDEERTSESDTTVPHRIAPPAAVDASDQESEVRVGEGARGWNGEQADGHVGPGAAEESPSGWEAREDLSGNFEEASRVPSESDTGRIWGQSDEKTMDVQRLFVGNLPFGIPSAKLVEELGLPLGMGFNSPLPTAELSELFGQFGEVEDVDMATYRKQSGAAHLRGKHRGFGFIRMSSESQAVIAMEVLHRRPFLGCILQVTPGIKKNPYTYLDDVPSSSSSSSSTTSSSWSPPSLHIKLKSTQKSTFSEGGFEPMGSLDAGGRQHCKLYVGRLNPNTDVRTLKDVFSAYGKVVDAKVVCTNESKMSLGFGFVTMHNEESAMEALKDRDSSLLDGNRIRVNLAQFPRTMR